MPVVDRSVDFHVHAAPSFFPRSETDDSLLQHAIEYGLGGLVLKAHEGSTAERASLLNQRHGGRIHVFGSITLNQFVGGWNAAAVDAAVALGARVVWAPTLHAANHVQYYGGAMYREQPLATPLREWPPVGLYDDSGAVAANVHAVLEVIAFADVVLATGHLAPHESRDLVAAARNHGVRRIVLTHPDLPITAISRDQQKAWARDDVFLEKSFLTTIDPWGSDTVDQLAQDIRDIGVDQVVLQTDLGQAQSVKPAEGWQEFLERLLEAGLSYTELNRVASDNAWALLT